MSEQCKNGAYPSEYIIWTKLLTFAAILFIAPFLVQRARAQFVNDGATNTLNHVTNFFAGSVTIGTNGSYSSLIITNGALLSNTLGSFIGLLTNASANAVTVVSFNSRWLMGGILTVGSNGSLNNLYIREGATVAVDEKTAIGRTTGADSNTVMVAGAQSVWTNRSDLVVGHGGSWNALVITNGGYVTSFYTAIGSDTNAGNNHVVVTDSGSVWTNRSFMDVGYRGHGNSLLVTNGGRVAASWFTSIGAEMGANSNEVTVTDLNSSWDIGEFLTIGDYGDHNKLIIRNGGKVKGTGGGLGTSSDNNQVLVSGANSTWTNTGITYVGWSGANNSLVISDEAQVANGEAHVGRIGNENRVTVAGTNSLWANNGFLYLGEFGSSNTLRITGGGTVRATDAYLGLESFSSNNLLHVQDGTLRVARFDSSSVFDIRRGQVAFDGGTINTDHLLMTNAMKSAFIFNGGLLITRSVTASNGQNFVVGANYDFAPATWDVRSNATPTVVANGLDIGSNAANATLLITNGATLFVLAFSFQDSRIGVNPESSNNLAIVSSGSVWNNGRGLMVGHAGSYNTLLITNRGRVASDSAEIGGTYQSGADRNQAIVTGTNSIWKNDRILVIGSRGSLNSLLISNGGYVASGEAEIGAFGHGNAATVTGAGSVWDNRGTLVIGNIGSFNKLLIAEGARVTNNFSLIGETQFSISNQVTVAGKGALWSNRGELHVGYHGAFNSLVISNGGTVISSNGSIGFNLQRNSNQVWVTGTGSVWSNRAELRVGYGGWFNKLLINDNGKVINTYGAIGDYAGAANNEVTINGLHSEWNNSGDLVVGRFASGNALLILNGGTVVASNAYVGYDGGFSNLITVSEGALSLVGAGYGGALDVRRGLVVLNGGTISGGELLLTNGTSSLFTFSAGTLNVRGATIANSNPFKVGIGTTGAAYQMTGSDVDLHFFSNGLVITNASRLCGNGTIDGQLTVTSGGTLSPGRSLIGSIILNDAPILRGNIFMEISKQGSVRTSDQLRINGDLFYGGGLVVSNLGLTPLAAGDTFQLFQAATYDGLFDSIILPTLNPGLVWTNKLLINGSIAVAAERNPKFKTSTVMGSNLVFSIADGVPYGGWTLLTTTNLAMALTNWTTNTTGSFDSAGNLILTNFIDPADTLRFFNIREP